MNIHGGNIVATAKKLGCKVTDLIDMSSNLSPLGMVPGLKETLTAGLDQISYLPETSSETLRKIFADKYGVSEKEILVGNGTTEFIFALPTAFAHKRAIIVNPTYSDYRLACQWAKVPARDFMLSPDKEFFLDLNELSGELQGGELVFICNPNNPTGRLTESRELHDMIMQHKESIFLVDESYLPFTREKSLLDFDLPPNLFLLCSSSKIYGIPGLRLGFLVSHSDNLDRLTGQRKPWGVNRIAQLAGEYLFQHADTYVEDVLQFLEKERPFFVDSLNKLSGIDVVPGRANFILCHIRKSITADEVHEELLKKRIMIRNCASFDGLDNHYFRMSLKARKENTLCLDALSEIF
ncbi:MAG: aminotransferase class I/II-fold pyridoxal phosphate-dependent enzyme [Desulfobulbaceae bacterium]|nr:aminotransferase class I/II-fold pyridoxal phosphate-dependent enzyme [Desulfobulbaceae bacterium]